MWSFQTLHFEHYVFLAAALGVMLKAFTVFRHLCRRQLSSEQSIASLIFIWAGIQVAASINYLYTGQTILFTETTELMKVFMLGGGVIMNIICYLVLDTYSKYRGVRRTRPTSKWPLA